MVHPLPPPPSLLLLGGSSRSPLEEKPLLPSPSLPPILCPGAVFIAVTPLPSEVISDCPSWLSLIYSSISSLFCFIFSWFSLPLSPPPPVCLASYRPLLRHPARYPACPPPPRRARGEQRGEEQPGVGASPQLIPGLWPRNEATGTRVVSLSSLPSGSCCEGQIR